MTEKSTDGWVTPALAPSSSARICVASMRATKRLAAWCSNYEFEDVIAAVDDVDLVTLTPGLGFHHREWLVSHASWHRGVRGLAAELNPGLQVQAVEKNYDVFVFICMNPWDLLYLNSLKNWEQRSKVKICYMVELYSGRIGELAFFLKRLSSFDHVMLSFEGSVPALQSLIGKPVHHVPLGADALRFTPFPQPPERVIDFYSMGKRSDAIHRVLIDIAARESAFYVYDTIPGALIQPSDHRQHRDLFANLARRSKFFMAYPAKYEEERMTRGQSEVGARFFEAAAAGAVMLGRAPTAPSFVRDFWWPDAVVDAGTSEAQLFSSIAKFKADPGLMKATSLRNTVEALRRFDWAYRWKEMLRLIDLAPSAKLLQREKQLHKLAADGAIATDEHIDTSVTEHE
jgi:hypothetical protein